MSATTESTIPRRRTIVVPTNRRARDIEVGDVLITGLVISVHRNEIDGEVRIETGGSQVHYNDLDDEVTVLGTIGRESLDDVLDSIKAQS